MKTLSVCESLRRSSWLFTGGLLLTFLLLAGNMTAGDPPTTGLPDLQARVVKLEALVALQTQQIAALQETVSDHGSRVESLETDMGRVETDLDWLMDTVEWLVGAYNDVYDTVGWLVAKVKWILDWIP